MGLEIRDLCVRGVCDKGNTHQAENASQAAEMAMKNRVAAVGPSGRWGSAGGWGDLPRQTEAGLHAVVRKAGMR